IDPDCNLNQVLDSCELNVFFSETDCNSNGIPDNCDIFSGTASDCDGSGLIDDCELSVNPIQEFSINSGQPIGFGSAPTESVLFVSGSSYIEDLNLHVTIDHPWSSDLRLRLAHNGTEITIFEGLGGPGEGLLGTVFDDESLLSITEGDVPFADQYRPIQALTAFDDQVADGEWVLTVEDVFPGDDGVLESWGIEILPRQNNDCNSNGILDRCESDCNGNLIPDECDLVADDFVQYSDSRDGLFGASTGPLTRYFTFDEAFSSIEDVNIQIYLASVNCLEDGLIASLRSPSGTEIVFEGDIIPYCGWNGGYREFSDSCSDGSVNYSCISVPDFSIFEGEDPRGTWVFT
ncbi:MAG: proprotein convertase P-domain-containing protein, partial [Planctomycetota bacterium]